MGEVVLDPPLPLADALRGGGAVADRTLLARLGVGVGSEVRIGETSVRITAVLLREPDRVGGLFGLGPRMLIHRETLDAAQVLLPGALARYEYKLALPEGTDAAAFAAALQRDWPDAGWRARSPRDVQPEVTRVTDRLATFLTLAGLTALLSGGLGIALTIETHLSRRTATIATLKSLGASGGQVFAIYLAQVMLLAVRGRRAGTGAGLGAAACGPAGAGGRVADLARARGLCRPSCPRRFGGAPHHLRVCRMAARHRPRDFTRAAVSRIVAPTPPLAATALLGAAGPRRRGPGGARRRRRAAAGHRGLVRRHRRRGRGPALGADPAGPAGGGQDRPSWRLRAAAGDRQPAPSGLAVAARDRGAWCRRHPSQRAWRCWRPISTTRLPCACRRGPRRSIYRRAAGPARRW